MNHFKWKFIPMLLSISLSFCIQGQEPLVKTSYVEAREGESLRELLEKRIGIPSNLLDERGYFVKIQSWNPKIEDFNFLREGQEVYVEIPYRTSLSPYQPKVVAEVEEEPPKEEVQTLVSAKTSKKSKSQGGSWKFSAFYTLSKGSFEESIKGSNVSTISNQDSPITLGASAFKRINNDLNYSGSVYFSKIDSGVTDLGEEVSIPFELGLTSYLGYQKPLWPLEIYGGVDLERFSSYNTDELPTGESLSTREHTFTYLTAGLSKSFQWLGKRFLAKASASKSIFSSQSRESLVNPEKFSGFKYIVYLNMKFSDKWFYHGLFKQHSLSGATDLTITRLGLGVGYSF